MLLNLHEIRPELVNMIVPAATQNKSVLLTLVSDICLNASCLFFTWTLHVHIGCNILFCRDSLFCYINLFSFNHVGQFTLPCFFSDFSKCCNFEILLFIIIHVYGHIAPAALSKAYWGYNLKME